MRNILRRVRRYASRTPVYKADVLDVRLIESLKRSPASPSYYRVTWLEGDLWLSAELPLRNVEPYFGDALVRLRKPDGSLNKLAIHYVKDCNGQIRFCRFTVRRISVCARIRIVLPSSDD